LLLWLKHFLLLTVEDDSVLVCCCLPKPAFEFLPTKESKPNIAVGERTRRLELY
jgi:hypothetical protein